MTITRVNSNVDQLKTILYFNRVNQLNQSDEENEIDDNKLYNNNYNNNNNNNNNDNDNDNNNDISNEQNNIINNIENNDNNDNINNIINNPGDINNDIQNDINNIINNKIDNNDNNNYNNTKILKTCLKLANFLLLIGLLFSLAIINSNNFNNNNNINNINNINNNKNINDYINYNYGKKNPQIKQWENIQINYTKEISELRSEMGKLFNELRNYQNISLNSNSGEIPFSDLHYNCNYNNNISCNDNNNNNNNNYDDKFEEIKDLIIKQLNNSFPPIITVDNILQTNFNFSKQNWKFHT